MGIVKKALREMTPPALRDVYYLAQRHRQVHGRYPRLLRPCTFSEKVCHRLMFDRRAVLTQFADKYGARAYIESRLGSGVLPRLYHVTSDPASIPWDSLPHRYVVKATHGSGWIRIISGAVDREDLARVCSQWLRTNYYSVNREWPYKNISPRILVEEFVDDGGGGIPLDFKFFAFGGEPGIIQVDASRFTGHTRAFYDPEWTRVPVTLRHPPIPNEVPRPIHLGQMIKAAVELSRGMDFLRVDLYDTPQQFYVGELTTAPGAGLEVFNPKDFDEHLGKLWRLPFSARPSIPLTLYCGSIGLWRTGMSLKRSAPPGSCRYARCALSMRHRS
jgi:TupA-like ATPgrasp